MPLKLCTEKVGHYLADLRLSDVFCKASFVPLLHPLDPITTPDDTEASIFRICQFVAEFANVNIIAGNRYLVIFLQ